MNAFDLSNIAEQSQGLLSWAMQTGAMVSLLIVIILIIRRPFAKVFGAKAGYALWALPVLRLIMPSIALPAQWMVFQNKVLDAAPLVDVMTYELTGLGGARIVSDFQPAQTSSLNMALILICVWAVGTVLWLGRQLYLYHAARQTIIAQSNPADAVILQSAKRLAAQLGLRRVPDVRVSQNRAGPLVLGLARPLILLPSNFAENFNATQQRYALMHELAHVKRLDLWAASLALLFRGANWPNPLVHYAASKFRADQEAACDASVLEIADNKMQARHEYGQTLLQAAKFNSQPGRKYTDVPIGLTLNHPLKERLMSLKTPMKKTSWMTRTAAIGAILIGATLTAPYTIAAGHPEKDLTGDKAAHHSQATHKSKTVIEMSSDDDGKLWKKKYEISSDRHGIEAWETDRLTGIRRKMDLDEIEGFDKKAFSKGRLSFSADKDGRLKFTKDGKRLRGGASSIRIFEGDIPEPPAFPNAPLLSSSRIVTIDNSEDGHVTVVTPDGQRRTFSSHDDMEEFMDWEIDRGDLQMHEAQAKLSAARALLDDMARDDLPEARREIESARKALAKAEKALAKANK